MLYLCEEEHYVRLPTIVKPTHYDLFLTFNFDKLEFDGETTICIEVLRRTKEIQLHAYKLEIDSIKLINAANGITFEPVNIEFSKKNQLIKIYFKDPVTLGNYRIKLKYQGTIANQPKGLFFHSSCLTPGDAKKITVFSHFETSYARRAFPCFDEPSFKTPFRIVLTVPKEYLALSTMPLVRTEMRGIRNKRYWFEVTPPMATYLLALAIGDFNRIEERTSTGITVGINVVECEKLEQGRFALETATNALRFFERYFKTPFPLPKLDFVVLPNECFDSDGMENWGLITVREVNILMDPQPLTNLTKRSIVLLICHFISHQWFGNLVTMEWWHQVWLFEALDQFAETACVDYFYPKFDVWLNFYLETVQTAMLLDEFDNTHPVEIAVKHPTEVDLIYDGISFNKGAALMRMLQDYVGEEEFRKALWMYLKAHALKNASAEDFYGALEGLVEKPIGEMMRSWIKQEGFPVVKVFMAPGCDCKLNQDGVRIKLVQTRFVNAVAKGKPKNEVPMWKIPISIISSKNPKDEMRLLMDSRECKFFIPGIGKKDWIKLNPGCVGFYRVQYSPELLKRLVPAVKKRELDMVDRISLLNDLFSMVKNGYTNTTEILSFLRAYEEDPEYLVWSAINRILNKLSILLSNTNLEDEFNVYRKNLISKFATALGWNKGAEENRFDHMVRKLVLGQMSWLEDEKMIEEARKKFQEKDTKTNLPNNLKMACYRTVVRSGGQAELDALMKLYKAADTFEERKSICEALGSSKDEKSLKKVLTFAMSSETNPNDTILIVTTLSYTKTGRDILWDYYRNHWRDILDKINNREALTLMIRDITEKYATEDKVMEMEEFFNKRLPCDEATFLKALETLRANAAWLERDSEAIQKYFSSSN